jgi:nucleoside-diphosphate kinase
MKITQDLSSDFRPEGEIEYLLITPNSYHQVGKILRMIQATGYIIMYATMAQLSNITAEAFFANEATGLDLPTWFGFLASDPIFVFGFRGCKPCLNFPESLGPSDIYVATAESSDRIRAYSTPADCHVSAYLLSKARGDVGENDVVRDLFKLPFTSVFTCCALFIIKPHVVNPHAGAIIDIVLENGLEISALRSLTIDPVRLQKLLRAYRGLISGFKEFSDEFLRGTALVLEIRGENVIQRLRHISGPVDPGVAKLVAPESIRARFGSSVSQNAVYCTEIAEDGPFESKLFFS